MPAYAVKHLVADHGPLSRTMKGVRSNPHAYTSKEPEASEAALGNDIYVIEVSAEPSGRRYALGYKYRAFEKYGPAGGGVWKGEFKFKVSATPCEPAVGVYFEAPVRIADAALCEWLGIKHPGMVEIPDHLAEMLEGLISEPANGARQFA